MKPRLRESANLILSDNKNAGKSKGESRIAPTLIAALILAAVSSGQGVQAQVSPALDGTGTQVQQNGNQFDITGGSPSGANLFHSFEQFGLDANQTANFLATPELRNILGRVVGGDPSIINGLIQVTGGNPNLFLMNPAGMVFGPEARLNVPASFFATTANGIGFGENLWFGAIGSNDYAALVGEPRAFSFSGLNGALANFGDLSVNPGQAIALSGSSVLNAGNLTAPGGEITITAVPGTNTVLLGQAGHLLSLEIDNSGLASLQQPTNLPSLLANNPSTHASQVITNADGTVTLAGSSLTNVPTTAGTAIAAGNLDVSTSNQPPFPTLPTPPTLPTLPTPTVGIFGQQLGIAADIDASGTSGGGSVFIGGDLQGSGSLPTALNTFVGSDSNINADALTNGDGGSVVIWADKNTIFNGTISARGGANGGNGGFVETSGKINLGVGSGASVDASAANGQPGQWLLDPSDITIAHGSTTADESGGNPKIFDTTGASADVTPATIESSLNAGTDVTITTAGGSGGNGDITVKDAIAKTGGGEATLTLDADRHIDIRRDADITSSSGKLHVVLDADTGTVEIDDANITTNGGNFTAIAGGAIAISDATISTNGGNFTATAAGTGLAASTSGITIDKSTVNAGAGTITLIGTGGSSGSNKNDGVNINSGVLETTTGDISITGTAGSGTDKNDGVELDSASVSTGSGAINIEGKISSAGGVTGKQNRGILIGDGGTIQSTADGSITLTGEGSAGTSDNHGILVDGTGSGSSILASGSGTITLHGTGGGNGSAEDNDGVKLNDGGALQADTGRIYITGIGGSGSNKNDGVEISNSASVSSASGAIDIEGNKDSAGGGTGEQNRGILIEGSSTIRSTAGGSISLTGEGSAGSSNNDGILVTGTGTGSISASGSGTISLNGTGGNGSADDNDGVKLSAAGVSLETDAGKISIIGIGGPGSDRNDGVEIRSSSSVSSDSGLVEITGTGGGTGLENRGIMLDSNGTYIESGGNITLTGMGSSSGTDNNIGIFVSSSSSLKITDTSSSNITLNGTGGGNGSGDNNDGVRLGSEGSLVTSTGAISITGIAGSGIDKNDGVEVDSASVRSGSGAIEIEGNKNSPGAGTGEENRGILIEDGSTVSTGGGSITLTGEGSAGTSNNDGILIRKVGTESSSISATGSGTITLNGTGGNGTADNNDGVKVNSASVSSESGLIEITGTGGGTGKKNRGILIEDGSTIESTAGGNITLTGRGSAGTSDNDGILVEGTETSISTTGSGTISITGTAGSGTDNNDGVELDSASVETASGAIDIEGKIGSTGGVTGAQNRGILIENDSTIKSTAGGNITLTGEGSAGTSDNDGILVEGTETSISATGSGTITLHGTGGGNGSADENDGVKLSAAEDSLVTDAGTISITGIAGSGTDNNDGVELDYASVETASGAIEIKGNITGTGGGTGQDNRGIMVTGGSTINSTGGGSITLEGRGSAGTSDNDGILVKGSGTVVSASVAGNVTLNGTGNGSDKHNDGVEIFSGAVVEVTAGELAITGIGSLGSNNNDGVEVDSATVRSQGSGAIEITGTAQATSSSSQGIDLENGSTIESTDSGHITLTGTTPADAAGIDIENSSIDAPTETGNVTLTADEINIGNSDIKGSGILRLEPLTPRADITIGSSSDTKTGILDLTAGDLSNLADGFASVIIGRDSDTGAISVESPGATFKDPVTLQPTSGSIAVNANLTGTGNASFTLNGDTTLRAKISTANQNIEINGNTTLGSNSALDTGAGSGNISFNGTVDGTYDLTLDAGTGNITVLGAIGNSTALGNLTANSSGTTDFNSTVEAASLTTNGLGSIELNGNVTTTGSQSYNDAVTVNGDISLTANDLDFTNTVSGTGNLVLQQFDPAQDMDIGGSGATGVWDLTASEIDNLSGFASLAIGRTLGSGTATITGGTFKLPTTIESANINLNGNIATTNKNISLNGNIAVTGDSSLNTGSGDITFGGTVDGNNNLTLSAGSGLVNFQEAAGATERLGGLTISSASTVNSNGGFRTNNSDLNFTMPVNLTGDSTFDAGNATANFENTLRAGSHDLTVTAAEIDFGNTVSGTGIIELRPADASGEIQLGGTDAGTAALELSNADLGQIQDGFSRLIIGRTDGNGAIAVDSSGVTFSDPTTLRSPLDGGLDNNLIVNGTINLTDNSSLTLEIFSVKLNADIISTGGNIDFGNAEVILGSDSEISTGTGGGNITIGGTIDSYVGANVGELTLNAGTGQVDLGGDIGNSNPLTSLSITGGTASLPTAIAVENGNNGKIAVNADASLNGNSTFSAGTGTIEFGSDLSAGANNLTLTADEINFNGGSNSVSGSGELTLQPITPTLDINIGNTTDTAGLDLDSGDVDALQNGFSEIRIGRADGSGAIAMETVEFSDPVRLRSPEDGGSLSINGAVTLLDDGKLIRDIADSVTILDSITQASGDIIFEENVELGADVSFSTGGGNIIFEGLLDGNKNLTLSATGFIDFQKAVGLFEPLGSLNMTAAEVRVAGGIATNDSNLTFNMPVNLLGDSTFNAGTGILEFNDALSAGSHQLGLVADEINLNDAVSGTGALEIQPKTPAQDIAIAGTNNNTSALDLTATELSQIQEGFSSITIGQTDSTGTVSVNSLSVSDPVEIRSGLGTVNIDGAITGTDNASIYIEGETTNLGADISTDGENITIDSQAILNADLSLDTGTGGGDITFTGTLDGAVGAIPLHLNAGSGEIRFEGVVGSTNPLGGLSLQGSQTYIKGGISADNSDLTFNMPVTIGEDSAINVGTGTLSFNGDVDAGAFDLSLTADEIDLSAALNGTGNLLLQPATDSLDIAVAGTGNTSGLDLSYSEVSQISDGFESLTIGSATGSGNITVESVTLNSPTTVLSPSGSLSVLGNIDSDAELTLAAQDLNLNANINSNGSTILDGNTSLGADVEINSNNNDIAINGTIDGTSTPLSASGQSLTLNAGSGEIQLGGAVGGTNSLTNLSVTAASTEISGAIATNNGDIDFSGSVTVSGSAGSFDAGTGRISFGSSLAALNQQDLTLTADEIDFNGSVSSGGSLVLQPATSSRDIAIGSSQQSALSSALDLSADEIGYLQDGFSSITIGRTDGSGSVTIDSISLSDPTTVQVPEAGGSIVVNGDTSLTDNGSLTLIAPGLNLNANIQSQGGDVTLDGNVTLGADASIETNNGAVTIGGTIDGSRSLTLDAGSGQIRLEGAVGATEALAGFQAIASETTLLGAVATDNGDISFSGDVAISGDNNSAGNFNAGTGTLSFGSALVAQNQQDLTFTANEIDLGGTVSSQGNLILQPASPGLDIAIGSSQQSAVSSELSALDLTADEIDNLQNGFRSVTIGRSDGSGAVSIDSISLSDPTTVRVPLEPGSIAVNGDIALTDNGGLTLIAPQTTLAGNINSSRGEIAINSDSISLNSDIAIGSGSGDIRIEGTVDGFQKNLILDTVSGRVGFAGNLDNAPLASLMINARVADLQGNITTDGGEVNIQAPITIQNDVFVTTGPGTDSETYGDVTASSRIDGPGKLIINAGNVNIGGNVGRNQAVESLEIDARGNVSLGNATTSGGDASIEATGDVNTGNISTAPIVIENSGDNSTGNINVTSNEGSVNTGNLDTSGAAIELDAAGSISTENINTRGGNLSLTSDAGNITTEDAKTGGGNVTAIAAEDIKTGRLTTDSGNINLTSNAGNITTEDGETGGGDFTAEASGDINTDDLKTDSGNVSLTSNAGNISIENTRTRGGALTVQASGDINTEKLRTSDGEVNLNSIAGDITIENARTGGGSLAVEASGDINAGDLDSNEGDINLTSSAGSLIIEGILNSSVSRRAAGNIRLRAAGDIRTGDIISSSRRRRAGDIDITSYGGSIATENITAEGSNVSLDAAENISISNLNQTGGDITLEATSSITTGNISSRSATGQAGSIFISAVEDITVGDINSSGVTGAGAINIVSEEGKAIAGNIEASSPSGSAGNITLQAAQGVSTGAIEAVGLDTAGQVNLTSTNGGTINTGEITTVATATGEVGEVTRVIQERVEEAPVQGVAEQGEVEAPSEITTEEISSGGAPPTVPAAVASSEEAGGQAPASSSDSGAQVQGVEVQGAASDLGADTPVQVTEAQGAEVQGAEEPQEAEAAAVAAEQQIVAEEANLSLDLSPEPEIEEAEGQGAQVQEVEVVAEDQQEPAPIIEALPELVSAESSSSGNNAASPARAADSSTANGEENASSQAASQENLAVAIDAAPAQEKIVSGSLSGSEVATPTTAENSALATETALNRQQILNAVSITATNNLAIGNIAEAVPQIEQAQASEYAEYFGGESFEDAPVTTQGIRDTLGNIIEETGTKPAIVYALLLPDQLEVVLVAPDGRPIRKVVPEAPKQLVMETVREFRGQLTNPRGLTSTRYKQNAQLLYKWLIAPIEKELQENKIDTLLFSMDSGLRSVPIAALHDGQQFLVEKYSLGLIPSISLTNTRYRSLQNTQVLAMGASEFPDLEPLPAVPIELATITEQLWDGEAFLNQEFTQENLLSEREEHGYEILHLATHGEFQAGAPKYSYIHFGDRKLGMDELRDLRMRQPQVELLVLSACRTAVGDETAELGFAGLAVQSGAKSALASLWYVSDKGTLLLMSEFYRQLSQVPIKAEALRQAQIAMIRGKVKIEDGHLVSDNRGKDIELPAQLAGPNNQDFSHPFYWSAFTMIGSPW